MEGGAGRCDGREVGKDRRREILINSRTSKLQAEKHILGIIFRKTN